MKFREESDLSTCKACGKIKVRKFIGKFDDRNKKYIDSNGCLWNGRRCPDCQRDKAKFNMKKVRLLRKNDGESTNNNEDSKAG